MARLPLWAMTVFLAVTARVFSSPQAATSTTVPSPTPSAGPKACNNSPDLCSRAYNNITHMGAHDSAFLRDASTGNSIAGNQYFNATVALSAGIRLLQAQVHLYSNQLKLCHTLCELLDAGPLSDWLAKIKHWLDTNPNDVVTLLLVNSDSQPASSFGTVFESSGISNYAFTPSTSTSTSTSSSSSPNITWPTLAQLISTNARLVTFVTSVSPSQAHPYLLPEFAHVFETPYNTTSLAGFVCDLDRPRTDDYKTAADALAAGMLPLLNHFAYDALAADVVIPDASDIDVTNSADEARDGALGEHVRRCMREWAGNGTGGSAGDGGGGRNNSKGGGGREGVKPVFVLVDFYDRGPAIETADRVNGIVPVGRTVSSSGGRAESASGKGVQMALAVALWFGLVVM
ncbi:hypothetical protein VTI74DRAFT_6256 [Chaetomium olivicolor]